MMFKSKYWQDQSGVAAVETALILPFLGLACFGAVDTSLMMLQNHKMESSLTAAGSYLAKTRDPKSFEIQAKNLATTGQISAGGASTIANWTANDVTIAYKKVDNPVTENGRTYNGSSTIDIIQFSSELDYQGLGFLASVWRKDLKITARYEERIVGSTS